ncbi:zinc finger protein 569-like [Uloborus diversus]|uniref:zinc finger protein 569-like n=1 Tax=Uloborus diversus TaxID=327109 RepID=UPI00240A3FCB|nr:zinc finger protein 569-like [Uloborus diversus]
MMEACDVTLSQHVEFVDGICLDKNVILPDGCTTTAMTEDGEIMPVTFIVSQSLVENNEMVEETIVADSSEVVQDKNESTIDLENERLGKSSPIYTMHFPSKLQKSNFLTLPDEEVLDMEKHIETSDNSLECELLEPSQDFKSCSPPTRLEDFMDVVTTYKCKFCRFSCPWKSGLMSHIRCCHVNEKKSAVVLKLDKEHDSEPKNLPRTERKGSANISHLKAANSPVVEPKIVATKEIDQELSDLEAESVEETFSPKEEPVEKHIFLCGTCNEGFFSLDDCKQHMINDHDLKFEVIKAKPAKKRGRPKTRPSADATAQPTTSTEGSESTKAATVNENKRQSRPPKALEEQYDFGVKKKTRRDNTSDRSFRCMKSGCGHRFSNEENLHYHYSSHLDIGKSFMCPECREEFEYWRGLVMHLWKEHGIDVDLYSCSECDYKTYSFFKVDNHRKIHSEERGFICNQCGKGFKQISQLRNHLVTHLDRKNLPQKRWYSEQECETCNRKFSDTKCLRKHQQAVHNKLKPYACSFCGHLSARKAMLQLHMRQHTGEKPFLCEHCDYRTGDHNSLRRHRMRHTGAKPYKCPHCPYACIQAISYKTHLRNKHPGMDGLFSCTYCTFKSVSKENFINHMSDHKRETENVIKSSTLPTTEQEETFDILSSDQGSVQMQLTDNALQQLEGILPGNMTAAQLIYSCLNAISQDGGVVNLPAGVTVNIPTSSTTSSDGTQTITIQLPSNDSSENEPYYFTIQQQDGSTALLLPTDEAKVDAAEGLECVQFVKQDSESLTCNVLQEDEESTNLPACSTSDLVIANMESFEDNDQLSEEDISAESQTGS